MFRERLAEGAQERLLDLHDFFEQRGRDVGPGGAEEEVDRGAQVSLLRRALAGERSGAGNGPGSAWSDERFFSPAGLSSRWRLLSEGGSLEEGSRETLRRWGRIR